MDDYLTKPLTLDALAAVLARWVPAGSVPTAVEAVAPLPAADAGLAEPEPPVLDAQVIGRLERLGKAAGEELLGQLAILFLADADARLVSLRRELAADDAAAVARSAHTLGGASANLGANRLADLCASLATNSATGDVAGGAPLLDAVEVELRRVRSALAPAAPTP
jgi:hypothetical protein